LVLNALQPWVVLIAVAVMTGLATLLLVPVAKQVGLVDHPGIRKVHDSATPLAGGPAIFLTLVLTLLWMMPTDRFVQALALGCLAMVLTGMADDRYHLSVALRFMVQLVACYLMIKWGGVLLDDFGRLMWNGVFELGWLAGPVTIFAAMGVINSFNMIDGMDGLAGSIFLVAAAGMALFSALAGQQNMLWLLLLSMASVAGFLVFNARFPWNTKAQVFLGDAGSLLLGFVLAWSFIRLGSGEQRAFSPMTAVWLIALPLLDTTTLIWRRWRSGHSAFAADQFHLHHAFLRAGYSVGETWMGMTLLAAVLAGIGILFEVIDLPEYIRFYVFMVFAFAYYFYVRQCWLKQRLFGRDFVYHDFTIDTGFN